MCTKFYEKHLCLEKHEAKCFFYFVFKNKNKLQLSFWLQNAQVPNFYFCINELMFLIFYSAVRLSHCTEES